MCSSFWHVIIYYCIYIPVKKYWHLTDFFCLFTFVILFRSSSKLSLNAIWIRLKDLNNRHATKQSKRNSRRNEKERLQKFTMQFLRLERTTVRASIPKWRKLEVAGLIKFTKEPRWAGRVRKGRPCYPQIRSAFMIPSLERDKKQEGEWQVEKNPLLTKKNIKNCVTFTKQTNNQTTTKTPGWLPSLLW